MGLLPRVGGRVLAVVGLAVAMSVSWRMGSGGAVFSDRGAQAYEFAADTLDAPTDVRAAGGTSVTLTWTATKDTYATGYRVLRGTTAAGPFTQVAQIPSRTTTTYSENPSSGQWWYVVRSYRQNWVSADTTPASAVVGLTVGYLQNDPYPSTGNTAAHSALPLSLAAPSATTLYNYDADRDTFAGLRLLRSTKGIAETDTTRMQIWRTETLGTGLTFSGFGQVVLWSASEGFAQGVAGSVTVAIRDVWSGGATTVTSTTVSRANWQGGATGFVSDTFVLPSFTHTFAAGHAIELKVVVNNTGSGDDMWLAYGTAAYPAKVIGP